MLKKLLKISGAILALIVIIIGVIMLLNENDKAVVKNYAGSENLKTIKPDWKGTPVDENGRFVNYEFPYLPKYSKMLRWFLSANPQKEEKLNDTVRLEVKDPTEFLASDNDGILWLGHASFFIRLNGKSILLDPVFGEPSFLKPLVVVPSPIEKIKQVDYVLLSHDHRDHTDENSIRAIAQKFPNAKFYGGLRMNELLKDWISPTNEVQTAGWFQQYNTPDDAVKITFLPVRHWCRRGLFDTNHILWGGYVIEGAGKTIYFSGDSGFGSHYKETAELFPKIDYFLIGIGAYKPRFMMEDNHNTPEEAVKAFTDAKAKILVPMHYGRFDMADEPPSEPLRLLKEEAEKQGLSNELKPLAINESIYFETTD
jgi:L-ascorbate metabolism protein UlaG (beta-lactamase superfamily)